MPSDRRGFRPTILSMMLLIAVFAVLFYDFAVPAIELIWGPHRSYFIPHGPSLDRPFWPQYWRKVRGVPEPDDVLGRRGGPEEYNRLVREIERTDDGGILGMTLAVATVLVVVGVPFVRKHKKWLFR